jgi:hypothetical protein
MEVRKLCAAPFFRLAVVGRALLRTCGKFVLTSWRRFLQTRRCQTDLNQAEDISPARFFAPSGPATTTNNQRGKTKEEPK